MDQHEAERFRLRILEGLAALDAEDALGRDGQRTVTLDQQSVGRLSRQDALQSQSMARATQARRDRRRQALQAALRRLDEDEFGYCDACGEEIPHERLWLDATVTRCVGCAAG